MYRRLMLVNFHINTGFRYELNSFLTTYSPHHIERWISLKFCLQRRHFQTKPTEMPSKLKKSTTGLVPVEDAIAVLTSAMMDPLNENVCGIRLAKAAFRVDEEIDSFQIPADKSKFAWSHPSLLRAGIKFFNMQHTHGDDFQTFQTFRNTVSHCSHGCIDDTETGSVSRSSMVVPHARNPQVITRKSRCQFRTFELEDIQVFYPVKRQIQYPDFSN